jgi:DNA-binding protein H-NS
MAAKKPDEPLDLEAMTIPELRELQSKVTDALEAKEAIRRRELLAELEELGGVPIAKPTRTRAPKEVQEGDARLVVKSVYRGPNGEEWSSRGAMPKWAKALGITDKAGLEPYRIKE